MKSSSKKYAFTLILSILLTVDGVWATNYWVSPSGSDSNSGLDTTLSWATIDNGCFLSILLPGDTVNILPGTYILSSSAIFNLSGTPTNPIVYQGIAGNAAIFDCGNASFPAFEVNASYNVFNNLAIRNSNNFGFEVYGRKNLIRNCLISRITIYGIYIRVGADSNLIHNNTFYRCGNTAIYTVNSVQSSHIFNNIVDSATNGMWATPGNVAGHNNMWRVVNPYFGGIQDSIGGISVDPKFVNDATGNFNLQSNSSCIDMALDLGYSYLGPAPDMGAFEFDPSKNSYPVIDSIGEQSVKEGQNISFSVTATDADGVLPVIHIVEIPTNATFVDSGNGKGLFNFNPDYTQAGDYQILFIASDGLLEDSELVNISVEDVNRPPVLVPIPDTSIMEGTILTFDVISSDPDGDIPDLTAINVPNNGIFIDENDGTGTFVFMPGFNQAGIYNVRFIASDGYLSDTERVQITVNNVTPTPLDEVVVTTIPVGINMIAPADSNVSVLAFKILNYYTTAKTINSITIRDASSGPGSLVNRLQNVDFSKLYFDKNLDLQLNPSDSLLGGGFYDGDSITFSALSHTILPGISHNFFVAVDISLFPRDGDTLDIFLRSSSDISFSTPTLMSGADSVNSFGAGKFNGLIAPQVSAIPVGTDTISPGDIMELLAIFDIPRNGYEDDTLQVFSLLNLGTAQSTNFDSLVLYNDNGNFLFDGTAVESRIGKLIFTGGQWTISGVNVPLSVPQSRFFVTGKVTQFPNNGSTVQCAIPQNGLQMSSGNDGPYDFNVFSPDTITIQTFESIEVTDIPLAGKTIIPGQGTGNIFAFQLTNSFSSGIGIDSLTLTLLATDPRGATQFQLDSQIDSVVLYNDRDGDIIQIGPTDLRLGSAVVSSGLAIFDISGLNIGAFGGTETITAQVFLNLFNSKNDNTINLSISDSMNIVTSPSVTVSGNFPISNPKVFTVNAFPAQAITINSIPGKSLLAGQTNQLVLDFELPPNGYANDSLSTIRLINVGSIDDIKALSRVRLYIDVTGDGFTIGDRGLGNFTFRDPYWELSKLTQLIIPPGARFLVTVDVANSNFDGGTLDFKIPIQGVTYISTVNGPDDLQVGNPNSHLIFPPDRVTAISIPSPSVGIFPGSSENSLLTFALYNGYIGQAQTLQGIILSNISKSQSIPGYTDLELGQIALYADNNKNRIRDDDSLLVTGSFSLGKLQFNGLNQVIPPESLSYFFIESSIPLDVIDLDSLAVSINSLSDFIFPDSVNLNGDVPVTSKGFMIINGSVATQYELLDVLPTTLRPGDSMVPIFAFKPAINGDQIDTLNVLSISNSGSADNTDISSMSLWLDMNSDETWQITDSLIGQFTFVAGNWTTGSLGLEVTGVNPSLFVLGAIDSLATNGTTFRGRIPINGCQYASANDGPIDKEIISDDEFTISASGLRVSIQSLASTYSIGQTIPVSLSAVNLNTSVMDSVYGLIVSISDSTIVTLDSSFTGPVSLNPGDTGTFSFYYSAESIGSTDWSLQAVDVSSAESSAVLQTSMATIQSTPADVPFSFINSIPAAVTKGQLNVFPLSLKITHPDSSGTSASIRIDSLQILVEDGATNPMPANTALSSIVLNSGFQTIAVVDTVPAQSGIWLIFNQPVVIGSGTSRTFSLLVDIDTNATASDFALAIENPTYVPLTDFNSGQTINLNAALNFPMRTPSCRIEDPSTQMAVSSQSVIGPTVNFGQNNVDIIEIDLKHPGSFGSSQVQLTGLTFMFLDTTGTPLLASELFENIKFTRQSLIIGDLFGSVPNDSVVIMTLNSPVTLSPGETVPTQIKADILNSSVHKGFSLVIADSSDFVVRELSSGSPISAVTDTTVLSSGSAFPMYSAIAELKQPAISPQFCIGSNLPPSVISGVDSLSLIGLTFQYTAASEFSSLRLNQISVSVRDSAGNLLNPDDLFDKIGYSQTPGTIIYQPFVQIFGTSVLFNFEDTGVVINPGDSFQFNLMANLEADLPFDHFVLQVNNANWLNITDATDTTNAPGVQFAPGCSSTFPFTTSSTEVFLPAGKPTLNVSQYPVQIVFPGQSGLTILDGLLDYQSATPLGDLIVLGLVGKVQRRTKNGLSAFAGNSVFNSLTLEIDGIPVAVDSILVSDSVYFTLPTPFILSRGETVTTQLIADTKSNAILGNYVISFEDSSAFDIEDADLGTPITPNISGIAYPIQSIEISLAEANLSSSFTNYPNPFNPARGEQTTIGFILSEDGYVNLEIYSITGQLVKEVIVNDFRTTGTYQSDVWGGLNDVGLKVIPGTYFCRISVRYASGGEETFRRKIAVVR